MNLRGGIRWIPCEDMTLRDSASCRDDSSDPRHGRALFDHLLSVVTLRITSPALRSHLGWDTPIPKDILISQLEQCIHARSGVHIFQTLIKEFGLRVTELDDGDLERLCGIVALKKWIPIGDELFETAFVVFQDGNMYPFRSKRVEGGLRDFLAAMGCSET